MSEKVKIISYVDHSVRIYIPELRVNRLFEKQGQSYLFEASVVEEMFYYPGIEELFTTGAFYMDDKDLRIKLGLEEEDGTVAEEVIAPISNTTILAYLNAKPLNEFTDYVSALPRVHQDRFVDLAIQHKITDYNKINVLKELTGRDIIKIIQLNEE